MKDSRAWKSCRYVEEEQDRWIEHNAGHVCKRLPHQVRRGRYTGPRLSFEDCTFLPENFQRREYARKANNECQKLLLCVLLRDCNASQHSRRYQQAHFTQDLQIA